MTTALAVLLLLLPLRELPAWTVAGVRMSLFDGVLLGAAVLCLPAVRKGRAATVTALALVGLFALALAVHPSAAGAGDVARVAAAAAVAVAVVGAESPRVLRILAGVLLAGATLQALIAARQLLHGGPVGLRVLGESQDAFYPVGRSVGPRGTFQHHYPLAGFAVLAAFAGFAAIVVHRARSSYWWAVALAAVPVGITYSRTAAVAVVLGLGSLAIGVAAGRAHLAAGLLAIAAGALVPALVWPPGWQDRLLTTGQAVGSGSADEVSTSRLYLAGSAVHLIRSSPQFGVGPAQYGPDSLSAHQAAPRHVDQVHNLPLYVAVVAGAPAGLLIVAILGIVGVRALRSGVLARTLYVAFLPFVLLDRFTYDGPQGFVLTAVWLGLVELVGRVSSEGLGERVPSPTSTPGGPRSRYPWAPGELVAWPRRPPPRGRREDPAAPGAREFVRCPSWRPL